MIRPDIAVYLLIATSFCFRAECFAQDKRLVAPTGVDLQQDVTYLEAEREQKLDLYQPAGHSGEKTALPAVVVIHGGGWANGDKARKREFVTCTALAKAGFVAVSINYETARKKRWPNNVLDCKNAVRWLRKNAASLGVDPDHIGVIGGSAGGHLAMMVAYTTDHPDLTSDELYPGVSDRVSACVNMYGISNLLTRKVTEKDGTPTDELKEHRLFKPGREEDPDLWRLASPVTHITSESPPTLIFHGTRDHVVDRDQSKELYDTLQQSGVESTLRMVEGARHAWPLKTDVFDLTGDMVEFFERHLKGADGDNNEDANDENTNNNDGSNAVVTPKVNLERPNVLFIAVDDLNDWQRALGGHPQVQTPNMDRLFEQGVLFTNAHCSQAVCNASRNSLLSGLHPASSGWYGSTRIMQNSYEDVMGSHKMLPEYFRDHGYYTLTAGKIFHAGASDYKDRTKDFWDQTGPKYRIPAELRKRGDGYKGMKFYPFPKTGNQISRTLGEDYKDGNSLCCGPLDREDMPNGKMFDELIAEWAVKELSQERQKPFFMAVGFIRPHVPFTAPRKYFDLYDPEDIEIPSVPDDEMSDIPIMGKSIAFGRLKGGDHQAILKVSDTYWREMVHGYLACVSFVDDQIGQVIEALDNSPHRDNTIVVLFSDHGQHLGEKLHWRKQSLWEEATRVPLYYRLPGDNPPTGRSAEAVSLLDIYPTLVDLCDLQPAEKLEGESLRPLIDDPTATRERPVVTSWYYGNLAVRSEDWRYIRYRDGTEELYNHQEDTAENHNVIDNPAHASVVAEHRRWLPAKPALPAGTTQWSPDKLDRRIKAWQEGSVPEWLR